MPGATPPDPFLIEDAGRPSVLVLNKNWQPVHVAIVARGAGDLDAWVDVVEPRGSELLVYLRLGTSGDGAELRVVAPPEPAIEAEQVVAVRFDQGRLHWFDSENERRVSG